MAEKVYEIAGGVAITSKGVVLGEGKEVTAADFVSEEVFSSLVKAKKILQVTKKTEEEKGAENSSSKAEKAKKGKKDEAPTSTTGAVQNADGTESNPEK